ncbi:MAG: DUF192 domain-containing protein [Candidatus Woesearchaeota archaeon]
MQTSTPVALKDAGCRKEKTRKKGTKKRRRGRLQPRTKPAFEITTVKSMLLIHQRTRKILATNVLVKKTLFGQARGMMFHPPLQKGQVMVFLFSTLRRRPVHLWFVFSPLDVVYVNEHWMIVEIAHRLKPWQYYAPKKACMHFLEFAAGTAKTLRIGDTLELI